MGDYDTRAGVTAQPITHRELNSGESPTHAYTCCASFFLKLLYHLVAKDKTWGFGNPAQARYKKLMKAKTKVQDEFQKILGRRIDTADGTGHTGNSLTGNLARRFFDDDCRKLLDNLVDPAQLSIVKKLHMRFNVILRIINSKSQLIDTEKFGDICTSTYIDILTYFGWVEISPTAHKILAYTTELIQNNACLGVGHLSEEGLEACHKIIRKFRSSWTLQKSDDANLKDLAKKMFLISDQHLYSLRRVIKCPKCGLTGHKRKCPKFRENVKKSESDIMVQDIFID